ncbi:MAG: DUF481 domain-containing protein [Acidiferrobacterales bacterium]|nr:DUF481 domain-containing protein [Gammaproteobacteria bacterium]
MPALRGVAALVGLLLLLLGPTAAPAPKTDKVTVKNGDVITGEIKSLQRGILRVSTDAMGTLDIKWEDVVAVSSDQNLLVETVDGTRYLGTLAPSGDPATIEVHVADEDEADAEVHEIPKRDVVLITPIEKKFIDKLKADLSLGYSFTKSSDVAQFTFAADVRYRTEKFRLRIDASSIITKQTNAPTSRTQEILADYRYFLKNRWFALALGGLQQNTELGIDRRTFAGGGGGRNLIQTNRSGLSLSGAVTAAHEQATKGGGTTDSVEAQLGLDYRFRDVYVQFTLIPSLTESNRVRSQFDTRFKLELVKDFFWELRFFASTDNKPPSGAISDSDYGIITSFGYSL